MAVTTWEEALEGLTPQEVWAMRKIRMYLRQFLITEGVEYSNKPSRFKGGYGGLDRLQFNLHGADRVIRSDDIPLHLVKLWLALDETIWSYGGEMTAPAQPEGARGDDMSDEERDWYEPKEALQAILGQVENSLKPSLMYLGGELEEQILLILLDTLPDEEPRIRAALKRNGYEPPAQPPENGA